MAGTVYINPTANVGGTGTQASPYNSWSQVTFTAGTTYLQAAGTTYSGNIQIGAQGTQAAPITIGSYGTGDPPVIKGEVNFDGANFVNFSGFQVTCRFGAGIILQNGANNLTIWGNIITSSAMGMWIGNAAGTTNTITANRITDNATYGIAINGATGSETIISHNVISGNGLDGINIDGNGFTIDSNIVSGNGVADRGSSGIHIYASSAEDSYGAFNVITGNICIGNRDIYEKDGNGILGDQWTHDNTISGNFCYANDGAGVGLYDSYNNTIIGNVMGGNELNTGGTHTSMGELFLNELYGLTNNNTCESNVALSGSMITPAVFLNTAKSHGNVFISNVFQNVAGGPVYDWNEDIGSSLSTWSTKTNSTTDKFTGVPLTAPSPGLTASFLFPDGFVVPLDGRLVTLTGWAPGYGLLGS